MSEGDCEKCQHSSNENEAHCNRYLIKSAVDSKPILYSSQCHENLESILRNLCVLYPNTWKCGVMYYYYVEMGNYYYPMENNYLLKDKDTLIVSTIDDLEDKPRSFNLGALFASLKQDVQLKKHQEEGVRKMIELEKMYEGGILADEMGLGKTLQVITMILRLQPVTNTKSMTLIVVPSTCIAEQWAAEIRTKTYTGSLPYFIYENSSNNYYLQESVFRVVIVTYDRLRADYKRMYIQGLSSSSSQDTIESIFDVEWHRVVLDESHIVRDGTMLNDAISNLKGRFRWCITGTPLQNNIKELHSVFIFLKIKLEPKQKFQHEYLFEVLEAHMIRRKRNQILQPESLIPTGHKEVIRLEFSEPERAMYDYLERLFAQKSNKKESWSFVFYLRLKQMCINHKVILEKFPNLIPIANTQQDQEFLASLLNSDDEFISERSYKHEVSEFEEALQIIHSYYDQFGNLQEPIDFTQLQRLKFLKYSTKMKWLIKFLHNLLSKNQTDKVIVVSQYVSVLKWIGEALKLSHIPFQPYHGELSKAEKQSSINSFHRNPRVRVLIMCLKAGGVGLNLQAANHMIFMDKWWNPAAMSQAIGRISRINQLKNTFVYTLVIKDTIEETIVDNILKKKNELFQKVIEGNSEYLEE